MDYNKYSRQSYNIGSKLINTTGFIVKNRLWVGFFQHRLVMILSVIIALVIPYSIFNYLNSKVSSALSGITTGSNIATSVANNSTSIESIFEGGNKYLVLILIQMLVVYFSNKTIEHLSGVTIHMSVKEMIMSQVRVINVSIRNWIYELIIGIIISVAIGIFGPEWMTDVLKFLVGSYFVRFLFIDNYNFAFDLSIKESTAIVRKHAGAALLVGMVAKILFIIPVLGALFVSFICSVATTWYMHTSNDAHDGKEAFV
ncbi:MAG: hypothetical protein IPO98_18115 [Saprospiraceae bacterium]|nr:hypothetical protein [Saprospiraceae bacterium]